MEVNVQMRDDYVHIVCFDNEAIELLHRICKVRHISSAVVMREIILGGLVLQEHLFVNPDKSGM